tara:strand:- start:2686 stop:3243 length:558 start_codon:yes stop_codon:yes gene_type:complete
VKKLYREYFQKSKVFLYPLLGIKKGVRFVPVQTYISWNDIYPKDKNKLLCFYTVENNWTKEFEMFAELFLETNVLFEEKHKIDDLNFLYIFDLETFKRDINKFKKGKYSKFTKRTKEIIMNFFGETGTISEYVESYLYPDFYYEDYSEILNVNIDDLQKVGELCSVPDLEKEDFKKDLAVLQETK